MGLLELGLAVGLLILVGSAATQEGKAFVQWVGEALTSAPGPAGVPFTDVSTPGRTHVLLPGGAAQRDGPGSRRTWQERLGFFRPPSANGGTGGGGSRSDEAPPRPGTESTGGPAAGRERAGSRPPDPTESGAGGPTPRPPSGGGPEAPPTIRVDSTRPDRESTPDGPQSGADPRGPLDGPGYVVPPAVAAGPGSPSSGAGAPLSEPPPITLHIPSTGPDGSSGPEPSIAVPGTHTGPALTAGGTMSGALSPAGGGGMAVRGGRPLEVGSLTIGDIRRYQGQVAETATRVSTYLDGPGEYGELVVKELRDIAAGARSMADQLESARATIAAERGDEQTLALAGRQRDLCQQAAAQADAAADAILAAIRAARASAREAFAQIAATATATIAHVDRAHGGIENAVQGAPVRPFARTDVYGAR